MTVESFDGGFVVTGDSIQEFRRRTLLRALILEIKGMKISRGASAYSIIKKEYDLKGSKQKVLEQFERLISEQAEQISALSA
jgi:hypothetical protein